MTARRVLITGVSRFWGGQLALRLEAERSVERIIAVDTQSPAVDLKRTEFLRADIRHGLIGKVLSAASIDTVVHAGLIVDPRRAPARVVHETNVIGTMNLLAACSAGDSPVRKLVVKSSTAIYGASPEDPSLWSEHMRRSAAAGDAFTRDLDEVEDYVSDFRVRKPEAVVTLLRFANVLGPEHDTPFARLFDLPAVPTVFGFDPRLQFLHVDDAVAVLERAVVDEKHGTFNVAGSGIVLLSQAIAMLGKLDLPVLPFAGSDLAMSLLNRVLPLGFPPHLTRLLQYGRVVDTSLLAQAFPGLMRHSTAETVDAHARERRVRDIADAQRRRVRHEAEMEEFLRGGATKTAAANGHRPRRSAGTKAKKTASRTPRRPVRRRGDG